MGSLATSRGVSGDSSEFGEHWAGAAGNTSSGGLCVSKLGKGAGMSQSGVPRGVEQRLPRGSGWSGGHGVAHCERYPEGSQNESSSSSAGYFISSYTASPGSSSSLRCTSRAATAAALPDISMYTGSSESESRPGGLCGSGGEEARDPREAGGEPLELWVLM